MISQRVRFSQKVNLWGYDMNVEETAKTTSFCVEFDGNMQKIARGVNIFLCIALMLIIGA